MSKQGDTPTSSAAVAAPTGGPAAASGDAPSPPQLTPQQRASGVDLYMLMANCGLPRVVFKALPHPEDMNAFVAGTVPAPDNTLNEYAAGYDAGKQYPAPRRTVAGSMLKELMDYNNSEAMTHLSNMLLHAVTHSSTCADAVAVPTTAPEAVEGEPAWAHLQRAVHTHVASIWEDVKSKVENPDIMEGSAWLKRFNQVLNGMGQALYHQSRVFDVPPSDTQDALRGACRVCVQCMESAVQQVNKGKATKEGSQPPDSPKEASQGGATESKE